MSNLLNTKFVIPKALRTKGQRVGVDPNRQGRVCTGVADTQGDERVAYKSRCGRLKLKAVQITFIWAARSVERSRVKNTA